MRDSVIVVIFIRSNIHKYILPNAASRGAILREEKVEETLRRYRSNGTVRHFYQIMYDEGKVGGLTLKYLMRCFRRRL